MKGIYVLLACFQRQVKDFLRYPNYLLKSFFYSPISSVLPFYFLMKACTQNFEKEKIFYILVSVILWTYIEFTIIETCNISNRELNIGMLDVLFLLPFEKKYWILGNVLVPNVLFMVSNFICISVCAAVLKIKIDDYIIKICFAFCGLFIQVLMFSVLVFVLNIKFKKLFNILLISLDVIYLLSGVTYPVEQLPFFLEVLGRILPFTWIFKITKAQKLSSAEIIFYILVNGIYILLVYGIYNKIMRDIKKDGQLSNF